MEATLRDISDAICAVDRLDKKECKRVYERARMLRDKGLIKTSQPATQGRVTVFNPADVAAAVTAIYASLSGASWGLIGAILDHLRAIDNTQGRPAFEEHFEAINTGKPIWVRVDVITDPDYAGILEGWTDAKMGSLEAIGISENSATFHSGTRQIVFWPITLRVKPVLDHLAKSET